MTEDIRWQHKGWHFLAHRRLGEVLFYYLARVRPFNPHVTLAAIDRLITDQKLGSVRVFPIFGPYDLLIRAWLHPSIETEFREWLQPKLEHCRALLPFAVTSVDYKWYLHQYPNREVDRDQLAMLNGEVVRAVQKNENPVMLRRFIEGNLVVERQEQRIANSIKFFVAINLEDDAPASKTDILRGIERFIKEKNLVQFASIYTGFGFCSILVKGQVNQFFDVATLPNWIGNEYAALGISTETYLVHGPTHVVGNEDIGDATFDAIEGKNLFIQSIIPELFHSNANIKHEIDLYLREVEHKEPAKRLSQHDKRLLHDYFYGLLVGDQTRMAQTLFVYFYSLESYLRENHKVFISKVLRSGPDIGDLYKKINETKESGKFLSLGDLLNIYKLAVERGSLTENVDGLEFGDWQNLVQIRNLVAHGDVDLGRDWHSIIETLLSQLPMVHNLVSLIEKVTDKKYSLH